MNFKIFNFSIDSQKQEWIEIWKTWAGREVYAHPEFIKLGANPENEVLAFYADVSDGGILFPIIKRNISSELWCNESRSWYDLITPYGYGGAFCWGKGNSFRNEFWKNFSSWCQNNNIVSTLMRLSLFKDQILIPIGEISSPYNNIVRSLEIKEENLWFDYKHSVRKKIKIAINSDLNIEIDINGKKIKNFLEIYYSTMDRVQAKGQYYFSKNYFKKLIEKLPQNFIFFHVFYKEKMISTELVLVSSNNIYSFLGGTIPRYNNMGPNNFLKHEIVKWGLKNGKNNFVLGGGYKKDDGIFKYKKAIAPNGECPFYLAKVIHDVDKYELLVKQKLKWKEKNKKDDSSQIDFFPKYRA
tara:strand:+ start:3817 stop:4881 length:1065 start_codon:yes stop_codon:yes gene_type:complete